MSKRLLLPVLLLLFFLCGCSSKAPEISGTAMITAPGIPFQLENAEGEQLNSTMKVYSEEYLAPSSPVDIRWTVNASREFRYTAKVEDYQSLMIQCDAYSHCVRGNGIEEITIGIEGVSAKSGGEETVTFLLFPEPELMPEQIDYFQIDCIGKELSARIEKNQLFIRGASQSIAIELGSYTHFSDFLTIPGNEGTVTVDFENYSKGFLTITDEDGNQSTYPLS